jgi:diacylglycerol kinase (ATP)
VKLKWISFRVALGGFVFLLRTQVSARWHLVATLLTVVAAILLHVTRAEWLALILAMALVWTAEALNTAIEQACDAITRDHHPQIGHAKDVAATAVLLASIFAIIVALFVFVPHLKK